MVSKESSIANESSEREITETVHGNSRRTVLKAIGAGVLLGGLGTIPTRVAAETSYDVSVRGLSLRQQYVSGGTISVDPMRSRISSPSCLGPSIMYYGDYVSGVNNEINDFVYVHLPYDPSNPDEFELPPGTYDVTFTGKCPDSGYTYFATLVPQAEEENELPDAEFSFTPSDPEVGEEIEFNASDSTDPDGSINAFEWNFGDGSTGNGEIVTHEYTEDGDYTVTLTVTDNDNAIDTTAQTVSVVVFADPLEVNGNTYLPKDSDGDGLFEDIDGDGTAGTGADASGLAQIIGAYQEGSLDLTDAQIAALDFNGDGSLTGQDNGAYNQMYR